MNNASDLIVMAPKSGARNPRKVRSSLMQLLLQLLRVLLRVAVRLSYEGLHAHQHFEGSKIGQDLRSGRGSTF